MERGGFHWWLLEDLPAGPQEPSERLSINGCACIESLVHFLHVKLDVREEGKGEGNPDFLLIVVKTPKIVVCFSPVPLIIKLCV